MFWCLYCRFCPLFVSSASRTQLYAAYIENKEAMKWGSLCMPDTLFPMLDTVFAMWLASNAQVVFQVVSQHMSTEYTYRTRENYSTSCRFSRLHKTRLFLLYASVGFTVSLSPVFVFRTWVSRFLIGQLCACQILALERAIGLWMSKTGTVRLAWHSLLPVESGLLSGLLHNRMTNASSCHQ